MELLISCIIVLLIVALLCYCIDLLPIPQPPIKNILKVLVILIGVLWIIQRSGLLR